MGITGLLPFLENASRRCYISEFRGCTVAIDSYCWLHKGAFACAEKLVRGEATNVHILYCLKYIQLLLSHNIKPIMVFDGQHLPAKKETEKERRERRKTARARGTELLRVGKVEEARQCFRQCVDITHEMALALIKECRKKNVDCIVAPYEADAQLAYLNMQGFVDIVITEDSDLILFGCSKILFKFSLDGSGTLVVQDKLNLAMKMRPDQYTFDKFRYMCILSGCDYLSSLPGIGLKKALKAIVLTHEPDIYKLLPRLPQYLRIQKLTVPQEYIENFKLADATLRHQVVYDPRKRALVRLTSPDTTGIGSEYLKHAGEINDGDRAFQMALGNIDPIKLKVMDHWNPDLGICNFNSIWSKQYRKSKSPQKVSNRPTVSAKSTHNQTVTVSSSQILAMTQRKMLEYDNKLSEELKMYQSIEPFAKRPKLDVKESNDDQNLEMEVETDYEVEEPISNPFLKSNKCKALSKFGTSDLENNVSVTSRFFAPKTKNSINNCDSQSQENDMLLNSGEEVIMDTNCDEAQCSNEDEEEFNQNLLENLVSTGLSLLPADDDGKSSYNKYTYNDSKTNQSNSTRSCLNKFKFKKLQKIIPSSTEKNSSGTRDEFLFEKVNSQKVVSDINYSSGMEEKYSESDVENLTPVDNFTNVADENISELSCSNYGNTDVMCQMENTRVSVSDEPEMITSAAKEKFKRSNSCRVVGLSRFKKKSAPSISRSQPTILNMFNKMQQKN